MRCHIIGFETSGHRTRKLLDAQNNTDRRFLPHVVGDGSARTFHECNSTMTSSLFEPNTPLVDKFQVSGEFVGVTRTDPVQTKRLDDIPEMKGTDLLKVDVQGAEVLVFDGAAETLKDVLGHRLGGVFRAIVQASVPVFRHRHRPAIPSSTGSTVSPAAVKPLIVNNDVNATMAAWLWADAIYIRDFMTFDHALLKFAVVVRERTMARSIWSRPPWKRMTGRPDRVHSRPTFRGWSPHRLDEPGLPRRRLQSPLVTLLWGADVGGQMNSWRNGVSDPVIDAARADERGVRGSC